MTVIFSTTPDDKYLFYLPVTVWAWNKIGVRSRVYFSGDFSSKDFKKVTLAITAVALNAGTAALKSRPIAQKDPNKAPTYVQVARLFAAADPDIDANEVLITSDIDMLVFKNVFGENPDYMSILGADLVPKGQYPMCYAYGKAAIWRRIFKIGAEDNVNVLLDRELGKIEADNMRGNYWCKDQELLHDYVKASDVPYVKHDRARPGTQFAMNRLDRDDAYILDHLGEDIFDYHMNRPGYEEKNFTVIMKVLGALYPKDNLDWIERYRDEYLNLM